MFSRKIDLRVGCGWDRAAAKFLPVAGLSFVAVAELRAHPRIPRTPDRRRFCKRQREL